MGSKSKGVAGTDQAFVLQRRLHVLQLFGVLVFEVAADAYFMFQVLFSPRLTQNSDVLWFATAWQLQVFWLIIRYSQNEPAVCGRTIKVL